jgi:hypothetical protein
MILKNIYLLKTVADNSNVWSKCFREIPMQKQILEFTLGVFMAIPPSDPSLGVS